MPSINAGVPARAENEVLRCFGCACELTMGEGIEDNNGQLFCDECYNDNYFTCQFCEEENTVGFEYFSPEGESICSGCYEDNYFNCEGCRDDVSRDFMNETESGVYCDRCYEEIESEDDEEDEEESNQAYDDEKDIEVKKPVELSSKRTFGIEFEMYNGKFSKVKETVEKLGFTYSGDGSISGNNGVEVQTSVLTKGDEDKVRKFTQVAKENGYQVNNSCGTHVHLGGLDFTDRGKFEMVTLREITGRLSVAVETTLYKSMTTAIGENGVYSRLFIEVAYSRSPFSFSTYYEMSNGKISRYSCVPMRLPSGRDIMFICRDTTISKLGTSVEMLQSGKEKLHYEKVTQFFGSYDEEKHHVIGAKNVLFFNKKETANASYLINLLRVYYQYNDLFMAMLPKERANNHYCRPLSASYTKADFAGAHNQEEIEKMWYKKHTQLEVEESKNYHYENSRYHFVNLHSLFGKLGTIEIRSHHGTLNAESILMWVKLHQTILDKIRSGNVYLKETEEKDIVKLFNLFVRAFGLKEGDDLYDFIVYRLKKFANIEIGKKVEKKVVIKDKLF